MKSNGTSAALIAALGLLGGANATAEGLYFAISGGITSADISQEDIDNNVLESLADPDVTVTGFDSDVDDSDKAWGVHVGYQWGSYVALEIGYVGLGEATYEAEIDIAFPGGAASATDEIRFTTEGWTAAVLGLYPIGERFDVHGRAGVLFADTRARERLLSIEDDVLVSFEVKDSSKELFAGVGGAWNINENFTLRLDYQRFFDVGDDRTGESDVDAVTVSILFR